MMVTPKLIIPKDVMNYPGGFLGEIFCRLFVSQFILFLFGVVSVYTIMFLSVERWLAVKYPFKYRTSISPTKMKICVAVIWVLAVLSIAPHLKEIRVHHGANGENSCKWRSWKSQLTRHILAVLTTSMRFVFPTAILLLVLVSLYKEFRRNPTDVNRHPGERRENQLLRLCTATSIAVLLCWSPNQVLYLLYKFDQAEIGTELHHFTVVLAMSTSSINPVIYLVTSKTYRACLLTFLRKICSKCIKAPSSTIESLRDVPLALVTRTNQQSGERTSSGSNFYNEGCNHSIETDEK